MSCMIQKPENTAAIAEYIANLLNMSYEFNGMGAPESLYDFFRSAGCRDRFSFKPDRIYAELVDLNYKAFAGRYHGEYMPDAAPEYKPQGVARRAEWGCTSESNYHFLVKRWHLRILKMIQFFNYQCAEDATRNTDLHRAMKELETELTVFIVHNLGAYRELSWE